MVGIVSWPATAKELLRESIARYRVLNQFWSTIGALNQLGCAAGALGGEHETLEAGGCSFASEGFATPLMKRAVSDILGTVDATYSSSIADAAHPRLLGHTNMKPRR
jgi:hypothetical protein